MQFWSSLKKFTCAYLFQIALKIKWLPILIVFFLISAHKTNMLFGRFEQGAKSSLFSICKSMEYTDCVIPILLFLLLTWFSIIWLLISSCLSGLSSINLLNFNKLNSQWKIKKKWRLLLTLTKISTGSAMEGYDASGLWMVYIIAFQWHFKHNSSKDSNLHWCHYLTWIQRYLIAWGSSARGKWSSLRQVRNDAFTFCLKVSRSFSYLWSP